MDTNREIKRAIEIGERNKEVMELAQNWCAHLRFEITGGVGLVEQQTGLPIGARCIRCPYAKVSGFAGMDLTFVTLDFYDRNCHDCNDRRPVRLPNLSKMVAEREAERQGVKEAQLRAEQEQAKQLEARRRRRQQLSQGSQEPQAGIFDIIERLDQDPSGQDAEILIKTARAAPDQFNMGIQEALFELALAGGWTRTEAALESLKVIDCDRSRLNEAALKALARGEASRTAGPIVQSWLNASHKELVLAAVPALVHLAAPVYFPFSHGRTVSPDPSPLLAVYKLFPGIVRAGIQRLLKVPLKTDRIDACEAVSAIIENDPGFSLIIAQDLIDSLSLPDDPYDVGPAAHAVASTLADGMLEHAAEIDAVIQASMRTVTEDTRPALFKTYSHLLKPPSSNEQPSSPTAVQALAFRRVVEVVLERPRDERLQEAVYCLGHYRVAFFPTLVDQHVESLLGAAALIADDLANPYSPLTDPRPTELKVLEAGTRQLLLHNALEATVAAVASSVKRQPRRFSDLYLETLQRLGEGHDELRGMLVKHLGNIGHNPEALPLIVPQLYTALMDRSQRVRAEAATAYGTLSNKAADDLPTLMHESFLVLLLDPYVVVHKAAVEALREARLPDQFNRSVINSLWLLILTYANSHSDDRFLGDCIEEFLSSFASDRAIPAKVLQTLLSAIGSMKTHDAVRVIRFSAWRLRTVPGFYDLVVKLLGEKPDYTDHIEELLDELRKASVEEIRRLAPEIQKAISQPHVPRRGWTDSVLDLLTKAGAWGQAVTVAQQAANALEDTREQRGRKLRAKAVQTAVELESSLMTKPIDAILSRIQQWRTLQQEIMKDDEGTKEARSLPGDLQLPSSGD
ncbi:MAG: hypothetical protein GDA67_12930 [Nitrospira sp. CR1.3]|nr:hypothetical protein [Nitrospira sp. CR1.3]